MKWNDFCDMTISEQAEFIKSLTKDPSTGDRDPAARAELEDLFYSFLDDRILKFPDGSRWEGRTDTVLSMLKMMSAEDLILDNFVELLEPITNFKPLSKLKV